MRCKACDCLLDDLDTKRKDKNGNFYDLCSTCHAVSLATEWGLETAESNDNIGNIPDIEELTIDDVLE